VNLAKTKNSVLIKKVSQPKLITYKHHVTCVRKPNNLFNYILQKYSLIAHKEIIFENLFVTR